LIVTKLPSKESNLETTEWKIPEYDLPTVQSELPKQRAVLSNVDEERARDDDSQPNAKETFRYQRKAPTKVRRDPSAQPPRDFPSRNVPPRFFPNHAKRGSPWDRKGKSHNIRHKNNLQPRRRNKGDKVIYYLHIHKAGGTTMCKQALKQRLSINFRNNCNVQTDQHCCGYQDSLERQIAYARTTPYDLVASEKYMYDAMATDHYVYVVTLRDSATRYLSHWNHLRMISELNPSYKDEDANYDEDEDAEYNIAYGISSSNTAARAKIPFLRSFGNKAKTSKDKPQSPIRMNDDHEKYRVIGTKNDYVGNFSTWWEFQPDNYSTRMICGPKCLDIPKFQITPELFRYTLERLSRFSHVLFLEDIKTSYAKFAKALKWNFAPTVGHENKRRNVNKDEAVVQPKVSDLMAANNLTYDPFMTALDDALYEFARMRYDDDMVSGNNTLISFIDNHGKSNECF